MNQIHHLERAQGGAELSVPDVLSRTSCSAIRLRKTDVGLCHDELESCCFHCLFSLSIALQQLNWEAEQAIPQKRLSLRRLDFGYLANAIPSMAFSPGPHRTDRDPKEDS